MRTQTAGPQGAEYVAPGDLTIKHPELYANHVALATCIRAWSESMTMELVEKVREPRSEDDYLLGYVRALRDMADHLLDGDGLPDSPFLPLARTAC